MDRHTPILADLVFLGGGHAHVSAIKNFAMKPIPGLRLTIVTSGIRTTYSGMLPGYIEGVWQDEDIHIDLMHLAQFAGARLIVAHCTGLDVDEKTLFFDERPPLHFDLLSINIGGQPDVKAIEGAENNTIPVKPITNFQTSFDALLKAGLPKKIAVIGGGAAGSELALAINKRWNAHGVTPHITLYSRSSKLLPRMSPRAAHLMLKALYDAGVKLQLGRAVQKIEKTVLYFSPGSEIKQCLKKGTKNL
jgi:NADH dehydrogenase, FAD-containing subunit